MTVVQTKLNATTSTTPALEFNRLSKLADTLNDLTTGIQSYSIARRPVADSANHGEIIYSTDSSAFYISEQLAWRALAVGDSAISSGPSSPPSPLQAASNYGYVVGGQNPITASMERFAFASSANGTSTGNLSTPRWGAAGYSSSTDGYAIGGSTPLVTPHLNGWDDVLKYPFASSTPSTQIGTLNALSPAPTGTPGGGRMGTSNICSPTSGYVVGFGGRLSPPNPLEPQYLSTNWKFPFSSPTVTDLSLVGDLTGAIFYSSGSSSGDYGYLAGGETDVPSPALVSTVEKWSFSSDGNSTSVGSLSGHSRSDGGSSGPTNGYAQGSNPAVGTPTAVDKVWKYSFTSDGNATEIGTLSIDRFGVNGHSGGTHGYASGGVLPSNGGYSNVIDRFPFSADTNSSDVGDLAVASRNYAAPASN